MKRAAKGTILEMGDGGTMTETFTPIAQVSNIEPSGLTRNTVDATDHDSPNHAVEKLDTTVDAGTVDLTGHWDPALPTHDGATGLLAKLKSGGLHNFQLKWPQIGANGFQQGPFAAIVTNFRAGPFAVDGKMEFSCTLDISGDLPDPAPIP